MHGDTQYAKSKNKPIKVKVAKSFDRKLPRLGVFLFGANHTLANLLTFPPSTLLLPEDFKSSITFDVSYKNMPSGNFPKKFKFKHLLPNVFRLLRTKFQISEEQFLHCFKEEPTPISCKNMNAFESFDHGFVFKVVDNEYVEGFLNLMPSYFRYLSERKFNTLLPQYCSIFKITIDNKQSYIIVMRNIMSGPISDYECYEINYFNEKDFSKDLENSDEKKRKKQPEPEAITQVSFKFDSPNKTKDSILEKASSDAKFLCENNVYGWSFLACRTSCKSPDKTSSGLVYSSISGRGQNFSYALTPLPNDYIIPNHHPSTTMEHTFADNASTKINCYFVNTDDLTHNYYFGCLDISLHCKHVKKSFADKIKKKQLPSPGTPITSTKSGDNEGPPTPSNHPKTKGKLIDPQKMVESIEIAFVKLTATPKLSNVKGEPFIADKSTDSTKEINQ